MKKAYFLSIYKTAWDRGITWNLGHNILELYNILVQIRLTASKTKRDI